ncbi:MAG: DoxX family protein [Verrucomicrobiae bacterium]|nr:DoxX family protein [Verrucomicrobiae bacterium]
MLKKIFLPSDDSDLTSMAIFVARLWFGLAMLFNHGFTKLANFSDLAGTFPDPLGMGHELTLGLVIFAEVLGALLLTVGLFTRLAAVVLVIDMFVAFLMVHKTELTGQNNGELAFLYLAGYVILLIAGGGLFSLDTVIFAGRGRVNGRPATGTDTEKPSPRI